MEIEEIHVQSKLIGVDYNQETKILTISSDLDPMIIDRNFNELEDKINKLEERVNHIAFTFTPLK